MHLISTLLPSLFLASAAWSQEAPGSRAAPAPAVLRLAEFEIDAIRFEDPPPFLPFAKPLTNFRGDLSILRQIAQDPKIHGLRLSIEGSIDAARALDLMEGIKLVKAAGKPIVCYAQNLTPRDLFFASHADFLGMPPMGVVGLEALKVEAFYMKDMLAKVGAEFEVLHVGAYKTAFEEMAADEMSAEQRETILCLLEELHTQIVNSIAEGRGLTVEAVEKLYDEFLVRPERAKQAGLIDAVLYEDEFLAALPKTLGADSVEFVKDYGRPKAPDLKRLLGNPFSMMVNLIKLLEPPKADLGKGPRIAIVYATGPILSGKSRTGFDGTVATMGDETIVEALDKARADDLVKAVVLRVNSPGGSALASDMIWHAVQRVRAANKPVVASMGNVAGSGGYWISMGCDEIVAQPSTITGSIGVVSALPDVSGSLKKLGVDVQVVAYGPRANDLTLFEKGPSEFLKGRLTSWMEAAYNDFVLKVAAGRKLKPEEVERIACGRVWTGRQAAQNGLVDSLGGLEHALARACVLGGNLDPKATTIVEYPVAKSFTEQLEEVFEMSVTTPSIALALFAHQAGLSPQWQVLFGAFQTPELGSRDRIQAMIPFAWRVR